MSRSKKGRTSTDPADVFRHEEEDAGFDNRARYGRMDNYEYEMPAKFDDEEIESDEAFNADDEARYAHIFGPKGRAGKRVADERDGEGDEEDEEEDEEEKDGELGEYEAMAMEPSSEDAGGDDKHDEDDAAAQEGLLARLSALTQGAKNAGGGSARRVRGSDMPQESEFGLLPSVVLGDAEGVGLREVAQMLGSGEQAEKAKKALKRVASRDTTSVPLGTESGKRVERKVAYAKARKDLSRWGPQIANNRNARQLVLGDVEDRSASVTTSVLASTFQATTGLEKNIEAILKESGADEGNIAKFEELEMHKLTVEEVAARAAQLAKMRSLMFHQEIKDRRQSKIKSRKYRKLLKKQKEKSKMTLDEMRAVNAEEAEEMAEKQTRDRALERITLRHRNTSKWVKGALRSGAMRDPGTREAIQAQLQQHELLRRKMGLDEDGHEQDDGDDDEDDEDYEAGKKADGDSNSSSEEDINDPAFDPDEDTPLPMASDTAPKLAPGSNLLQELVVPHGHRVRASGFISAKQGEVHAQQEQEEEPPLQQPEDDGEEEQGRAGKKKKSSKLMLMGDAIKQQLQEAPPSVAAEQGSSSQFHLSGKVQRSKEQVADRAALVRLAFASDDAAQAFAEEKQKLEEKEAGKDGNAAEEDLEGWGSWTGEGVAVKKKRKKKQKPKQQKRKAGELDHVYVNPKLSEQQKHLKAAEVPYPFTSKEQYEANMALPLGRDFNSGLAFVDLQKPEVVVKRGSYLKPIEYVAPDEKKTKAEKKRKMRPKNMV